MTRVTSLELRSYYLTTHRIDGRFDERRSREMTKFYCLVAALAVFAPFAFATMNQAALMVA